MNNWVYITLSVIYLYVYIYFIDTNFKEISTSTKIRYRYKPEFRIFLVATTEEHSLLKRSALIGRELRRGETGGIFNTAGGSWVDSRNSVDLECMGPFDEGELCDWEEAGLPDAEGRTLSLSDMSLRTASGDWLPNFGAKVSRASEDCWSLFLAVAGRKDITLIIITIPYDDLNTLNWSCL